MDEKSNTNIIADKRVIGDDGVQKGITEEQQAFYQSFKEKEPDWHRVQTKKLLRKVDFHLLPFLAMMYLLSFLDKNNLAQAKLGTLEKDLGMKGTDFNTATSIFFVGYVLLQVPSNLVLARVRPSLYLGIVMSVWGAISAATAGTHSFAGLVVVRLFLGFAEAPFFAGALFLMSSWYTRAELAHRFAWFYSGAQLSNAFGGLIAAGVLGNLNGAHGIAGWRWLFIIEGVMTIGVALLSMLVLPDYPAKTRWLSPEETSYAQWRLIDDTGEADFAQSTTIWDGLKLALRDPRVWIMVFLQHCSNLSQTFMYFFPSIVKTLGYGNIATLLITAPVWIATFLVSLLVTWTSGRSGDRSIHIICLMLIAFVGNVMVTATTNVPARFVAMFMMPMGANSAFQIIVSWVANSFPRPFVKRGVVVALASTIANCATIYGSYMYPNSDAPRYTAGGTATACVSLVVAAVALSIRFWHIKLNKKLAEKEIVDSDGNIQNLHADDPDARAVGFRYIL